MKPTAYVFPLPSTTAALTPIPWPLPIPSGRTTPPTPNVVSRLPAVPVAHATVAIRATASNVAIFLIFVSPQTIEGHVAPLHPKCGDPTGSELSPRNFRPAGIR